MEQATSQVVLPFICFQTVSSSSVSNADKEREPEAFCLVEELIGPCRWVCLNNTNVVAIPPVPGFQCHPGQPACSPENTQARADPPASNTKWCLHDTAESTMPLALWQNQAGTLLKVCTLAQVIRLPCHNQVNYYSMHLWFQSFGGLSWRAFVPCRFFHPTSDLLVEKLGTERVFVRE